MPATFYEVVVDRTFSSLVVICQLPNGLKTTSVKKVKPQVSSDPYFATSVAFNKLSVVTSSRHTQQTQERQAKGCLRPQINDRCRC